MAKSQPRAWGGQRKASPGLQNYFQRNQISRATSRFPDEISTRELGTIVDVLKKRLSYIFKIVTYQKVTLLLNEADVFVEQRAINNIYRNTLIYIFLRKLKYYKGILFLITNQVKTINKAIISRIYLALQYGLLDQIA